MRVHRFVPIVAALLAMAVSGCAVVVVDDKGKERTVDLWFGDIKPNEKIVAPADYYPFGGGRPWDLRISDYGNKYGPGSSRYIVGGEFGISRLSGETDHFFPPANVSGSSFGATGGVFAGYHRAFSHDPINQTTTWGRLEGSFTFGDISVQTPPNFGNEILRSHARYIADFSLGASIQFHKNQVRPTDICIFILGGPSFAKVETEFANWSRTESRVGWHVGAGIEIEFAPKWVIRGGVKYTDLGKFALAPGVDVKHEDVRMTLGIGYRQSLSPPPP
jgi:opacity protein-like surface antigen